MANGTLEEEVRRRKAAEYLNGSDDEPDDSTEEQDAVDDSLTNVSSSDSDSGAAEDLGIPDDWAETDQATETVPAPSKKYEYNYVLKPVGTDFTQTPSPPRPPSLEPVE